MSKYTTESVVDELVNSTLNEHGRPIERRLRFKFRFPVVMVEEQNCVDMIVPLGNKGASVLDVDFMRHFNLSDAEIERSENAVLRQIAIVPYE